MNLSLIDPFVLAQDYPDTLTGKLSTHPLFFMSNVMILMCLPGSGHATCLRFNRKGDYLAAGRVGSMGVNSAPIGS
jgi:COMPASS component SWD1